MRVRLIYVPCVRLARTNKTIRIDAFIPVVVAARRRGY